MIDRSVRLLRALRAQDVPVDMLANSGTESFDLAYDHLDVLTGFGRTFIFGRMGVIKADPAIYTRAEADLGISGDAIHFTGNRDANVAAAEAQGWRTHLFTAPGGWIDRLIAEGLLATEAAE